MTKKRCRGKSPESMRLRIFHQVRTENADESPHASLFIKKKNLDDL
jgi:hypothetical protein